MNRTRVALVAALTSLLLIFVPASESAAGPIRSESTSAAPVALGVNLAGAPDNPAQLDSWASLVGRRPALVMWYQSWDEPLYYPNQMSAVVARGEAPLITWMPESVHRRITLSTIAAGGEDSYIRAAALAAKAAAPTVIYIRFAHEMNGNWSPWGQGVNGNTPAQFIAAWRHVVSQFRAAGASNVRFVWSPNVDTGTHPFANLYPGDPWVDLVGLDGYNWGTTPGGSWRTVAQVFGPSYATITALTSKPLIIAETASTEVGGNKAAWITTGLLQDIPALFPKVRAVVWFDRLKETDWRVNSSAASLAAFRLVVASSEYGASLAPALASAPTVHSAVSPPAAPHPRSTRRHRRR